MEEDIFMKYHDGKDRCSWDIKQFFHKENQTVVEWYFKNEMNTGSVEEFDDIS